MDWYRSSRESPEMRARAAHHFKSRRTSIVERNDVIQAMKLLAVRLVALQETLLTNSDSSQLSAKRSTTGRFPANLKRPPPLPSDADWTTLRARLDLAQTLKIGGTVETVILAAASPRCAETFRGACWVCNLYGTRSASPGSAKKSGL